MGFNLSRAAEAKDPFQLPDPGLYYGYVEKGTIKTSTAGNTYINFEIALKDMEGNKKGKLFWMFFDADWQLYQTGRFLRACEFEMEGELELKDIAVLAEKHDILVALRIEQGKDGYRDKIVPDFNTWKGFYNPQDVDHWDAIINKHMDEEEAPALVSDSEPIFDPTIPEDANEEVEY